MRTKRKFVNICSRNCSNRRIYILLFFVIFLFSAVFLRLCQVQILKHGFYKALAQDQHEFFQKIFPKRGEIFIKDNYSDQLYPMAVNKELGMVYAVPKDIQDKEKTASELSGILEMDEKEIFDIINKPNDPYEVLKRRVSDDKANIIKSKEIQGIKIAPEVFRYYPGNNLAANLIGFVGFKEDKRVGQYGTEGYHNKRLEGSLGFLGLEKDALGSWISFESKNNQPPKDGENIVLTIDQTIQYIAEKKLSEAISKFDAESGDIIIMDPKSGEIIAMAQYPTYNPNEYFKQEDMSVFLNSSVHNVYEPGSIQKPITMAIGIDLKKFNPETSYIDEGSVSVDGWTIRNSDFKKNGKQTMTEVLEKSLNTGTIFAQQKIDKDDFYEYLKKFGLDEKTGIEIAGESKGNLSNLEVKNDINYATASYGQGISVTPIAMIAAISSFANDGKIVKPHIVSKFISNNGTTEEIQTEIIRRVVSPRTASLISAMMVSVIENGHAKQAKLKGYKLAGKTGTAQVPQKNKRGYEKDKTIHTFVGFGPIPNPKFSILIKLDYPKNALFAANTTAPVFSELAKELVSYYNISPTEKIK